MNLPKVTIIIPTKDNLRNLKRSIQSIFETAGYPFKLIIIESESTDGTKEWLNELKDTYPESISVYNTKAEGSIKACNLGISKADKDSHIYLTQDDVYFKPIRSWLRDYVAYSEYPKAGVLTSCGLRRSGPDYLDGLEWCGSWDMFIPLRALQHFDYKIFDENFKIGEDIEFAYRLKLSGLKIVCFNDFMTIDHHQQRDSPHQNQSESVKQENAKRFKEKHKL